MTHVEQVGFVWPDRTITDAIRHDNRAQILGHRIHHSRAHTARRRTSGDEQGVDVFPEKPAGQLGCKEGRWLAFADDEFACRRREFADDLTQWTGFRQFQQARCLASKGASVRSIISIDNAGMRDWPTQRTCVGKQVLRARNRLRDIASTKVFRVGKTDHEINDDQGWLQTDPDRLRKPLLGVNLEF